MGTFTHGTYDDPADKGHNLNSTKMILRTVLNFNRVLIKPSFCARVSTYQSKCASDKAPTQGPDWEPIFRFPAVKWVAAFNRLKIYQLGLTGLGVPASFVLQSTDLVASELGLVSLALGVTGCLTLGLCSYFSKNVIGFIYINKQRDQLKFAYVDYWGRRKHVEVPVESVVPFTELPASIFDKFDFYQKVIVADSKDTYKLAQKYGEVADRERFSSVFGE